MVKEWINAIRRIVQEEIKVMQKYQDNNMNTMKYWSGVVDTVYSEDNTATVLLPGESVPTSKKQNKTGQILLSGDQVVLFSMSGKLGDSYIIVSKSQYLTVEQKTTDWTIRIIT